MPSIDPDNAEARILAGILSANRRVAELHEKSERAKLAAKLAKEEWEAAATDLQAKLSSLDAEYPLFDRPGTVDAAVAPDGAGDEWTVEADRPALPGPKPKRSRPRKPAKNPLAMQPE